ncbi:MAG: hypothetical protein R3E87_23675 [Burkholderiaceae bacterium]
MYWLAPASTSEGGFMVRSSYDHDHMHGLRAGANQSERRSLMKARVSVIVIFAAITVAACGAPNGGEHGMHHATPGSGAGDTRQLVRFPETMREHTLSNMRDHLVALGEIQQALADGSFDVAAKVAEQRLGMSSLGLHGAHEVAAFMPQAMQDAGTAMHRSASRFAVAANDASATGELKPALAALAEVNKTCVACHAAFRLQ